MCRFALEPENADRIPLPLNLMSVVVGAHRIQRDESSQRRHDIKEAIVHEKYPTEDPRNDIMLLRLKTRISFNNKVKPICVDSSEFSTNTECYVAGWGSINSSTADAGN